MRRADAPRLSCFWMFSLSYLLCRVCQLSAEGLGGPDPSHFQVTGSVWPGSLGPGLLRPLVWTLSTLCPGV